MQDQIVLGVLAIVVGLAIGVVLFVPFVMVSYRRRGRLSAGRLLLWLAALIYFWAIWTYTLLPLPDPDTIRCVGAITDPMSVVRDIRKAISEPGRTITNPAMLQLVFNVMLFIPLGFFVRVIGGRGILAALLVGFGLSLFIETTQLTGVWGLYPCAYRFFDVGDLMTNTTGAVLGAVVGLVVPRAYRGMRPAPDAGLPRPSPADAVRWRCCATGSASGSSRSASRSVRSCSSATCCTTGRRWSTAWSPASSARPAR
ncbi:VanZ family protein [Microbacterium sp. KUDC0406]|uniref:VanZ family protein n=1 Tax=Microbacterium sp. KUDC0406 TaxID=2909588 RepID=UPI001F377D1A|nr:VanZ family protein [Microbacterium sp. KUDC0406]UJP09320.1 VanZ family protein [Microbacterium sp. KUDC0406]